MYRDSWMSQSDYSPIGGRLLNVEESEEQILGLRIREVQMIIPKPNRSALTLTEKFTKIHS